jgi:hypothetical protein
MIEHLLPIFNMGVLKREGVHASVGKRLEKWETAYQSGAISSSPPHSQQKEKEKKNILDHEQEFLL